VARFFSLARLSRASLFSKSAFDTLRTMLSALLSRPAGVSPGTLGAGFIHHHDTRVQLIARRNEGALELAD
jgi:hypothetical protein